MTVPAPAPAHILLVEDDDGIGGSLGNALRAQGYRVSWARDAAQARRATGPDVDLVLLDLGLPDLDGVALCRELRQALPNARILILTARNAEVDVVIGLDAGADDYVVKPFRLHELLARLRAHLRRGPTTGDSAGEAPLVVGLVRIDRAAHRCTVNGIEVPLRPREFALLCVLLGNAGRAVSRESLMAQVWDENWYGTTKTLDMHIGALRRKLADHGERPDRISTLRGYGYRYEADA